MLITACMAKHLDNHQLNFHSNENDASKYFPDYLGPLCKDFNISKSELYPRFDNYTAYVV